MREGGSSALQYHQAVQRPTVMASVMLFVTTLSAMVNLPGLPPDVSGRARRVPLHPRIRLLLIVFIIGEAIVIDLLAARNMCFSDSTVIGGRNAH